MSSAVILALLSLLTDGASEQLTFPPVVSSGIEGPTTWSATLTVEQHRHVNSQVAFNTRSYCFQSVCSYPGPTIILFPGDNFTLVLENMLGPDPSSENYVMNTMHSPNTTNVHTHGLHISPEVDTVFIYAEPGDSLTYPYQLPVDHAPGTHWYHAHYHGSSTYQIMSGMVGALVVKPLPTQNVPFSITAGDSYLFIVTRLKFDQEVDPRTGDINQGCGRDFFCDPVVEAPMCTGEELVPSPYESFRIYSYLELGIETGSNMAIEELLSDPTIQDMLIVNGMYLPTLTLTKNSYSILQVIAASGGGELYLSIKEFGVCVMSIIAYDGVYLEAPLLKDYIGLTEGSRADIQIMCSEAGSFSLLNENTTQICIFEVSEGGGSALKPPVTSEELYQIVRPSYLSDLMGDDVKVESYYSVHTWRNGLNHSICGHWIGAGSNCSELEPLGAGVPNTSSTVCPFGQFAGPRGNDPENYTSVHKLVTPVGAINEWTIIGMGNDQHPIHLHVHHMQVISYVGDESRNSHGSDMFFAVGQWRDTLPAFQGVLTVRFRAADFTGETVVHCHFLRHEDLGMMDTFLVTADNQNKPSSNGSRDDFLFALSTERIILLSVGGAVAFFVIVYFSLRLRARCSKSESSLEFALNEPGEDESRHLLNGSGE